MTREEIRQAFRQAQQEEFAAVPQQPVLQISPKWERKMERKLGLAPRRISKKKRLVILLLAAVILALGACTAYEAFTNGASIKLYGPYQNFSTDEMEYHYLIGGYLQSTPLPAPRPRGIYPSLRRFFRARQRLFPL